MHPLKPRGQQIVIRIVQAVGQAQQAIEDSNQEYWTRDLVSDLDALTASTSSPWFFTSLEHGHRSLGKVEESVIYIVDIE